MLCIRGVAGRRRADWRRAAVLLPDEHPEQLQLISIHLSGRPPCLILRQPRSRLCDVSADASPSARPRRGRATSCPRR